MNRRDLARMVELKKLMEEAEQEDSFSFCTDDISEELNHK